MLVARRERLDPNRQIRSLPAVVRLVVCGPRVLLTSKNLVLAVHLMPCGPPVVLSSSVKNSVNDGRLGAEHQICVWCSTLLAAGTPGTNPDGGAASTVGLLRTPPLHHTDRSVFAALLGGCSSWSADQHLHRQTWFGRASSRHPLLPAQRDRATIPAQRTLQRTLDREHQAFRHRSTNRCKRPSRPCSGRWPRTPRLPGDLRPAADQGTADQPKQNPAILTVVRALSLTSLMAAIATWRRRTRASPARHLSTPNAR